MTDNANEREPKFSLSGYVKKIYQIFDTPIIKQAAENYHQQKWYASERFLIFAVVLAVILFCVVFCPQKVSLLLQMMVVLFLLPAWYLSVKGYRWVMLGFIAYCVVSGLHMLAVTDIPLKAIMVWDLILCLYAFQALGVESYRIKHNLITEKHSVLKDHAVAAAIFILSVSCFFYFVGKAKIAGYQGEHFDDITFVELNLNEYPVYCLQHGYKMKEFPSQFAEKYKAEIRRVYKYESWQDRIARELIFAENVQDDETRKELKILGIVLKEIHEKANSDVVTGNAEDLSPVENCYLFDKSFDILQKIGYFDEFEKDMLLLLKQEWAQEYRD